MNKILMILTTLFLVSCAENNDNVLLDEILFGKEDPNAPIVNLDNEFLLNKQSNKADTKIPVTDFLKKTTPNNATDNKIAASTLINISDKYCANSNGNSEYKNELKKLAQTDSINASIINKLIKCYETNESSKNQQNSCIVYVCQQEVDKAKKQLEMDRTQNLINKGKAQKLIDLNNAERAIEMNRAKKAIATAKQNNLNEQPQNNIQSKTIASNEANKVAATNQSNTTNLANIASAIKANTPNTAEPSKSSEPLIPERERSILLRKARAGDVENNDKNLVAFCRMSSQLIFFVTNNLIMEMNNNYPRSMTYSIPSPGIIEIKNSFAYKILKITESRLGLIKEKIMETLPFDVAASDDIAENYQSSYYKNCLKNPTQHIFNYTRIFQTDSEPQWSSFLRRQQD